MEKLVALTFSGVAEGSVIALAAVGLVVLHKASGVINFAHGDLITLGAYTAVWLANDDGWSVVWAGLAAIGILFGIGVAMERVAIAPLRGRSVHVVVIATLGVAVAIRSLIGIWQGTTMTSLDSPVDGSTRVFGAAITHHRFLIIVVAAAVIGLLILLFEATTVGRQLRALAADRDMARLAGVRAGPLSMLALGLSSALAGLAGYLIAPLAGVDLALGFGVMLNSFAAMIIGGFGSLRGVIAAAMLIGLLERLVGGYVFVNYASTLPFVFMILAIAYRPQGLSGSREYATRL